jgi:transposase
MLLTKTYKFKLYRSKKNRCLDRQLEIAGCIYNHCIALHRRYYRLTGKHLNAYELMKHLTKRKKLPKYAFWKQVGSQAIQDIVERIERAYKLFYKLAHELTDRYDHLFFEELGIKGMQALWGRKIGDLARSEFMGILTYAASVKGKVVHLVDRFYPSSKTCAACGHLQSLKLSDRRWVCDLCGASHDRDHNAAVNILREGASSLGLGDVRLSLGAIAV